MINSDNIYKDAVKRISEDLNLKIRNQYSQDWEYESADSDRVGEFLEYYVNHKLNSTEKQILVKLILESYNDYVGEKGFHLYYTKKVRKILESEYELHNDIIKYWSCEGEELENAFYITPLIREIAESMSGHNEF